MDLKLSKVSNNYIIDLEFFEVALTLLSKEAMDKEEGCFGCSI